jgi:hypothetical protein
MEEERREREQRNHELQLKMFESIGGGSKNDTPPITVLGCVCPSRAPIIGKP